MKTVRGYSAVAVAVALAIGAGSCTTRQPLPASVTPTDQTVKAFPILERPQRIGDKPPEASLAAVADSLPKGVSITDWRWLRSTRMGNVYLARKSDNTICFLQYTLATQRSTAACPRGQAGVEDSGLTIEVDTDPDADHKVLGRSQLVAFGPAWASYVELTLPGRPTLKCAFSNNIAVIDSPPAGRFTVTVIDDRGKTMRQLPSALMDEDGSTIQPQCS